MLLRKKKNELLTRASAYHRAAVYDPSTEGYLHGFVSAPVGFIPYKTTQQEPIVEALDLYDLDSERSWLTVNHYNALIINSKDMLIADIDFGDPRMSRFATLQSEDEVIECICDLHEFDKVYNSSLARQSYRVYRTLKGCRVICTSKAIPIVDGGSRLAVMILRFLRADPEYIRLCDMQQCYRARLTPKPWRADDGACHVCNLIYTHGDDVVAPELEDQLSLHDDLVLRDSTLLESTLA